MPVYERLMPCSWPVVVTLQEYAEVQFVCGSVMVPRKMQGGIFSRLHQRLVDSGTALRQPQEVGALHHLDTEEVPLNVIHNESGIITREVAREVFFLLFFF